MKDHRLAGLPDVEDGMDARDAPFLPIRPRIQVGVPVFDPRNHCPSFATTHVKKERAGDIVQATGT